MEWLHDIIGCRYLTITCLVVLWMLMVPYLSLLCEGLCSGLKFVLTDLSHCMRMMMKISRRRTERTYVQRMWHSDFSSWMTTDNRQQTTDNGQRTTDNEQRTTDNKQLPVTANNKQPSIDNGQQQCKTRNAKNEGIFHLWLSSGDLGSTEKKLFLNLSVRVGSICQMIVVEESWVSLH